MRGMVGAQVVLAGGKGSNDSRHGRPNQRARPLAACVGRKLPACQLRPLVVSKPDEIKSGGHQSGTSPVKGKGANSR